MVKTKIPGMKMVRKKPPIASKLVTEPSQTELFDAFGEDSEKYGTLPMLMSHVTSSGLPNPVMNDVYSIIMRNSTNSRSVFHNIVHTWRDLFKGFKVFRTIGKEVVSLPIGELHRPKIKGCTANYVQSYERKGEFSMSVKVLGVGFGGNMSRKLGFSDKIEITENCVQLTVPVTLEWEECKFTRGKHKGTNFYRSNVKKIGKDWDAVELTNYTTDKCGVSQQMLKLARWYQERFSVPRGGKWTRTLNIENSQGAELSLETKLVGTQIGPKAVVKYLKTMNYSYDLIGPQNYIAYFPKNSLAYYWSWS
jgi:hypothetical protein